MRNLAHRAIYRLALRWVNQQRRVRGAVALDEMLLGVPSDGDGCGLARSLGAHARVFAKTWRPHPGQAAKPLPLSAYLFRSWFDQGRYPELVAGSWIGPLVTEDEIGECVRNEVEDFIDSAVEEDRAPTPAA